MLDLSELVMQKADDCLPGAGALDRPLGGFGCVRGSGCEGKQYVEFVQFHDDLLWRGSSIGTTGFVVA